MLFLLTLFQYGNVVQWHRGERFLRDQVILVIIKEDVVLWVDHPVVL